VSNFTDIVTFVHHINLWSGAKIIYTQRVIAGRLTLQGNEIVTTGKWKESSRIWQSAEFAKKIQNAMTDKLKSARRGNSKERN